MPAARPDEFDVEVDDAAVVDLAARLVRLRTVHEGPGDVERPAAELLAELMRDFGWAVTSVEAAPGRPSVIGVVDGGRPGRTLMFEGHVDVVTEGDPGSWSFDPYAGDIMDGRLRGRGSADMKAGVAAMLHAARAVELGGFAGRIVVGVLADEEGMMLGAKRFAADLVAGSLAGIDRIDGVIVGEPEGGEVCPVAKGAIRLVITFTGAMAHGAMPWMGRNPLPAIAAMLAAIADTQHVLRAAHGDHPLLGPICLTPTVLQAGDLEQINVMPATATVALDIRTTPAVVHAALITQLADTAGRIAQDAGLTAQVTVIDDRPPVDTPVDHPVVQAMLAGHRAATGADAVIGGVPGATDGTILTRDAGLATVVYGPGGKWIAHQADEYVPVADIATCTRAYVAAARHFLGD
ncbi:M20 family metallopeptidase [Nakamurella sp.]|uniref:M20 family metallopeptidase n=1 Tax=Nakamurella sp. TaxID=1869182 RepID=UPI00378307AC